MVFALFSLNPIEILFLLLVPAFVVGVIIVLFIALSPRGRRKNQVGSLSREEAFEAEIDALEGENKRLREELAQLKNDRAAGASGITKAT